MEFRSLAVPPATSNPWTLDVLGAPTLAFAVAGRPAAQGAKTAAVETRSMRESSKAVKSWRDAVRAAADAALPLGWQHLTGPVVVDFILTMPRTTPTWWMWHDTCPVLSMLACSTEAALTRDPGETDPRKGLREPWEGVWKDDGQVTAYRRLDKVRVGTADPDALPELGAVIRVWRVPVAVIEAADPKGPRRTTTR